MLNVLSQKPVSQKEPIRVDVNLVTLRFSVKDSQGAFFNEVEKERFRVLENGVSQEISFFQLPRSTIRERQVMWLAFLLDVSGSTFATRDEEILAARTFFENVSDFTKVGVFGFTDQLITFQDFTEDRRLALKAFSSAQSHLGKTAIYRSLDLLISRMNERAGPTDSKVIIVISDAMDDEYRRGTATSARSRMANTEIYTVWVPSAAQLYIGPASNSPRGASNEEAKRIKEAKEGAFSRVSAESGGRHFGGFEALLDFDGVLAQINDEIFGNLYSVGYYTDDPYLSRYQRNISVLVDYPDARVSGMFKDVPDRDRAKRDIVEAFFDSEAPSQFPGDESIPIHEIGVELDLLRPRQDGSNTILPFRIKISPYSLQRTRQGDLNSQFGVLALLADSFGNETVQVREIFRGRVSAREIAEAARGVIYTNRLHAPPGEYTLRLAVLEIPTWRMTIMERRIRMGVGP
jgi:VWFA-related protein